jgi:DNA-binding protein YbaB
MDLTDKEELEDLLLVAINRVLELAEEKAGVETQSLLKDMMPPGLGNLFG